MADLSVKSSSSSSKKKKNKRKLKTTESEDNPKPPKTHRIDSSEKQNDPIEVEEEGGPWSNLQLILSIQNREINILKKVELAFGFVSSRVEEGGNYMNEDYETVKTSRLIVFLNDWIQSLLISSDKKIRDIEPCLDFRCWGIFKFCLEESLKLHVSLSFSRNLLRAIACVAKNALSLLNDMHVRSKELVFDGEGFELYSVVIDCVSLVFSSDGCLSNENLDLWVSTVDPVLQLVQKIFAENLEGGNAGVFVLRFSCLVLEPFSKFLRVHPTRKNGFQDFVDKLLEPLLHLLGVLHLQIDGGNPDLSRNLMKLVEEVLSHGLYHPIHTDGFLGLRSTEKYIASHDGKSQESKTVIKSYHRHLFDKLERIVAAKKVQVLSGLGELFHLLVDRVKKQKGASLLSEGTKIGKTRGSRHVEDDLSGRMSEMLSKSNSALQEKSFGISNLNAEARKSLFDFFVQIMEPLLLEMNGYLQAKLEMRPALLDAHCLIKSINKLLASLLHEKVYLRTEDTSEGACCNFLKKAYNIIVSFASNLLWLSKCDIDDGVRKKMFPLLAKEVIVAVGYFLDIEYQVIGNDLISLWLMIISYLAIGPSFINAPDQRSLNSQILDLGCQLVKLYSELRQVKSIIFALCKAIRVIICNKDELNYAGYLSRTTSLPYEAYARSVGMLLWSPEFKLAIHNAIKSIPEGQASAFVEQLTLDLSESMEWMKVGCSVTDGKEFGELNVNNCNKQGFDVQAELLGRGLSEMYALVLDSLTVTTGNSNLLGLSLKDLMTVIRPCLSSLVGRQPVSVNEFLLSVTGKTFDKFEVSGHWFFVFFFRLYMSSRSLYRQAISLMPPDTSIKMSAVMGDSFTAYSGRDWMETTEWTGEGYFSWIVQPSASLLPVIHSVSDYLQESVANCCPLIYVLNAMALQRLVDLNRQIKSLEYLLQNNDNLVQNKLLDDDGLSLYCKRSRKCKRCISDLKDEASGLTEFMMDYLSLVNNDQLPISTSDDATHVDTCAQALHESDMWNLGVGAVNEKSLSTAIWWIVCQNIDIWCAHAAKKKLKMFLSLLIHTSLPSITSSFVNNWKHHVNEAGQLNKVTVRQISLALLSDSNLYEHKFVRRHFASRFCHILKKLAVPVFSDFSIADVDFSSSPNWSEVLRSLENSSTVVSGGKPVVHDVFPNTTLMSCSSNKLLREICREQNTFPFTACQSLLSLLCWIPKGYLKSKSISLYATYILNLERLLVGSLLECRGVLSSHKYYELLRLFLSCRRSLKCIIMASCEENTEPCQSSIGPILSEVSFFVLWLFKSVSVVVGLREAVSEACAHEFRDMIFSLMDQTSYVFLMLSKYQSTYAVRSFIISEKPCKEQPSSDVALEQKNSNKTDRCVDSSKDIEAWKSVLLLAESLKEQTHVLFIPLKDVICNEKKGVDVNIVNLNKLSSIVSCFSGFLWGLASALNHTDAANSDDKGKLLRWEHEAVSKLKHCINAFADFISFFLHMLVVEDDKQPGKLCDAQISQKLEIRKDSSGSGEFSLGDSADTAISCGKQHQQSGAPTTSSASPTIDDDPGNASVHGCGSQLGDANCAASVLSEVDSYEHQYLNKNILRSLLKGDHPEVAFSLRVLLIAYSAILRLNLQINSTSLSSLVPLFTGISQVLLLDLADTAEMPQSFAFVWLDGVLKYLEELGSHFPLTNPTLTRNAYAKLIELHIRALGKCISLQGKKATLASHETESSTKILQGHIGSSEVSLSHGPYCLDDFKARLRMSFKVLIHRPSELHLLSAIQAIERALVGVQESCTTAYEINTGIVGGGKVSSIVAAGIDCLDLVLEYVSGRKRLSVVKRHIHSLIAGLFNIILHLQSPLIFYGRSIGSKADNVPDPGSVILMCVEVLTRVSGKHALFQMDSWHVGHSLRIPGALFQGFHQLRISEAPSPFNSPLFPDNEDDIPVESMNSCIVDRQFSIELFAACCRLLYTVLKHHKSDCERCIALLEESARVLLHCLETVHTDLVAMKGYFSWDVQEGVKCACFLRRIYEEIRHQKDVFSRHCFKFLSSYIWVYSGYGPLKTGIRREIDEALKPGVYALIDACSTHELQYLHTVFGEGPCRNTLASLQHDYKLNFQYAGKV